MKYLLSFLLTFAAFAAFGQAQKIDGKIVTVECKTCERLLSAPCSNCPGGTGVTVFDGLYIKPSGKPAIRIPAPFTFRQRGSIFEIESYATGEIWIMNSDNTRYNAPQLAAILSECLCSALVTDYADSSAVAGNGIVDFFIENDTTLILETGENQYDIDLCGAVRACDISSLEIINDTTLVYTGNDGEANQLNLCEVVDACFDLTDNDNGTWTIEIGSSTYTYGGNWSQINDTTYIFTTASGNVVDTINVYPQVQVDTINTGAGTYDLEITYADGSTVEFPVCADCPSFEVSTNTAGLDSLTIVHAGSTYTIEDTNVEVDTVDTGTGEYNLVITYGNGSTESFPVCAGCTDVALLQDSILVVTIEGQEVVRDTIRLADEGNLEIVDNNIVHTTSIGSQQTIPLIDTSYVNGTITVGTLEIDLCRMQHDAGCTPFITPGPGPFEYTFDNGFGETTVFSVNEIDMDINQVEINDQVLTFTAEDGTQVQADICQMVALNCNSPMTINSDGSVTYVDNAGNITIIPAPVDVGDLEIRNDSIVHTTSAGVENAIPLVDANYENTTLTIGTLPIDVCRYVDSCGVVKSVTNLNDTTFVVNYSDGSSENFNVVTTIEVVQDSIIQVYSNGVLTDVDTISSTPDAGQLFIRNDSIIHVTSSGIEQGAPLVDTSFINGTLTIGTMEIDMCEFVDGCTDVNVLQNTQGLDSVVVTINGTDYTFEDTAVEIEALGSLSEAGEYELIVTNADGTTESFPVCGDCPSFAIIPNDQGLDSLVINNAAGSYQIEDTNVEIDTVVNGNGDYDIVITYGDGSVETYPVCGQCPMVQVLTGTDGLDSVVITQAGTDYIFEDTDTALSVDTVDTGTGEYEIVVSYPDGSTTSYPVCASCPDVQLIQDSILVVTVEGVETVRDTISLADNGNLEIRNDSIVHTTSSGAEQVIPLVDTSFVNNTLTIGTMQIDMCEYIDGCTDVNVLTGTDGLDSVVLTINGTNYTWEDTDTWTTIDTTDTGLGTYNIVVTDVDGTTTSYPVCAGCTDVDVIQDSIITVTLEGVEIDRDTIRLPDNGNIYLWDNNIVHTSSTGVNDTIPLVDTSYVNGTITIGDQLIDICRMTEVCAPSIVQGPGTFEYTFDDGHGNTFVFDVNEIDMDIDTVTVTNSTLTFTSENGTNVQVDICAVVADNCNSTYVINTDGSATYTDNAGNTTTIPAPADNGDLFIRNDSIIHVSSLGMEQAVNLVDTSYINGVLTIGTMDIDMCQYVDACTDVNVFTGTDGLDSVVMTINGTNYTFEDTAVQVDTTDTGSGTYDLVFTNPDGTTESYPVCGDCPMVTLLQDSILAVTTEGITTFDTIRLSAIDQGDLYVSGDTLYHVTSTGTVDNVPLCNNFVTIPPTAFADPLAPTEAEFDAYIAAQDNPPLTYYTYNVGLPDPLEWVYIGDCNGNGLELEGLPAQDSLIVIDPGSCNFADPNNPTPEEIIACAVNEVINNPLFTCPSAVAFVGNGTESLPEYVLYIPCEGDPYYIEKPIESFVSADADTLYIGGTPITICDMVDSCGVLVDLVPVNDTLYNIVYSDGTTAPINVNTTIEVVNDTIIQVYTNGVLTDVDTVTVGVPVVTNYDTGVVQIGPTPVDICRMVDSCETVTTMSAFTLTDSTGLVISYTDEDGVTTNDTVYYDSHPVVNLIQDSIIVTTVDGVVVDQDTIRLPAGDNVVVTPDYVNSTIDINGTVIDVCRMVDSCVVVDQITNFGDTTLIWTYTDGSMDTLQIQPPVDLGDFYVSSDTAYHVTSSGDTTFAVIPAGAINSITTDSVFTTIVDPTCAETAIYEDPCCVKEYLFDCNTSTWRLVSEIKKTPDAVLTQVQPQGCASCAELLIKPFLIGAKSFDTPAHTWTLTQGGNTWTPTTANPDDQLTVDLATLSPVPSNGVITVQYATAGTCPNSSVSIDIPIACGVDSCAVDVFQTSATGNSIDNIDAVITAYPSLGDLAAGDCYNLRFTLQSDPPQEVEISDVWPTITNANLALLANIGLTQPDGTPLTTADVTFGTNTITFAGMSKNDPDANGGSPDPALTFPIDIEFGVGCGSCAEYCGDGIIAIGTDVTTTALYLGDRNDRAAWRVIQAEVASSGTTVGSPSIAVQLCYTSNNTTGCSLADALNPTMVCQTNVADQDPCDLTGIGSFHNQRSGYIIWEGLEVYASWVARGDVGTYNTIGSRAVIGGYTDNGDGTVSFTLNQNPSSLIYQEYGYSYNANNPNTATYSNDVIASTLTVYDTDYSLNLNLPDLTNPTQATLTGTVLNTYSGATADPFVYTLTPGVYYIDIYGTTTSGYYTQSVQPLVVTGR